MKLLSAHLHTGVFVSGTGLTEKLDMRQTQKGFKIEELSYSREHRELTIKYKGVTAIVPNSNIACMTPIPEGFKEPVKEVERLKPGPRPKAQVSGPHDHVFAQGPGKTRD